jgi:hypothetical protein
VGDAGKAWKLRFDPDVSILDGLKRVISLLPNWKIDETQSGRVGVASATDPRFDQPGVYTFVRDHTCWSYSVEYDDSDAAKQSMRHLWRAGASGICRRAAEQVVGSALSQNALCLGCGRCNFAGGHGYGKRTGGVPFYFRAA